MKQGALWGFAAAAAATVLAVVLSAKEPPKAAEGKPSAPAKSSAAAMADQVVFTFTSDEQMRQFANLWQQRQASLTRLAVLQAYVTQEEAETGKLNQQLEAQYHLQMNKHYTLDTDRHVLIERWEAPQATPDVSQKPAPVLTPASESATP